MLVVIVDSKASPDFLTTKTNEELFFLFQFKQLQRYNLFMSVNLNKWNEINWNSNLNLLQKPKRKQFFFHD